MARKAPGSSEQSVTVLHRAAQLYEGESWWLTDRQGEVRGLLFVDGGEDVAALRQSLLARAAEDGRFTFEREEAARVEPQLVRERVRHSDCQVTVEERSQLFSPFRDNGKR